MNCEVEMGAEVETERHGVKEQKEVVRLSSKLANCVYRGS